MAQIFNILRIDNEKLLGAAMAAALCSRGHEVAPTSGGTEGIKRLNEEKFDLVITDLAPSGFARPFFLAELIDAVDSACV